MEEVILKDLFYIRFILFSICSLLKAAVEARVLVLEVAERHDIIIKLKNELNEMEQLLKQKDTHIQFKDEIIRELRQQRRSNFKVVD